MYSYICIFHDINTVLIVNNIGLFSSLVVIETFFISLTLLLMGEGGPYVPPQSVFIFLPKISPPDQTLKKKKIFL